MSEFFVGLILGVVIGYVFGLFVADYEWREAKAKWEKVKP